MKAISVSCVFMGWMVRGLLRGGTIAPVSILTPGAPAGNGSVCHKHGAPPPPAHLDRVDAPRGKDLCCGVAGDGPAVCPINKGPARLGAKPVAAGFDTHAPEVEAVRIPASPERRIAFGQSPGVQPAGLVEQFEAAVVEMHEGTAQ